MTTKQMWTYTDRWNEKPLCPYIPDVREEAYSWNPTRLDERIKFINHIPRIVQMRERGLITKTEAMRLILEGACDLGDGLDGYELRKLMKSML